MWRSGPEDVVAVPRDYDNAKMRTCRYEVVGEVEQAEAEQFFAGRWVVDDYSDEESDWDEEEDADPDDRIDGEGLDQPAPHNPEHQPAPRRLFHFWPFLGR